MSRVIAIYTILSALCLSLSQMDLENFGFSVFFNNLSLPVLFYFLCCFIAVLFYFLSRFLWKDATRNLLGYTAGLGNIGYFGLPVAISLFDKNLIGITVLCILGFVLFSNSLGFF